MLLWQLDWHDSLVQGRLVFIIAILIVVIVIVVIVIVVIVVVVIVVGIIGIGIAIVGIINVVSIIIINSPLFKSKVHILELNTKQNAQIHPTPRPSLLPVSWLHRPRENTARRKYGAL